MKKQLCSVLMLVGIFIGNACAKTTDHSEEHDLFSNQPQVCNFMATIMTSRTTCGESNGEIVITSSTGTNPIYFLLIKEQGMTQRITFPDENTFSNLPVGAYVLTGWDANQCELFHQHIIIDSSRSVTIDDIQLTSASCFNANDGEITITATSAAQPITFKIAEHSKKADSTVTFEEMFAGMYTIQAIDANGCSDTQTVYLTQPDDLQAVIIVSNAVGEEVGGSAGSVNVSVSGGTPPYLGCLYSHTGEAVCMNVPGTFDMVLAGNYILLITDQNGCTTYVEFPVPSSTGLMISGMSTQNPTAYGVKDGSIIVMAELETSGNMEYMLFLGMEHIATNPTGIFDGLGAGTYKIEVQEVGTEYTSYAMVTLTEPDSLIFTFQTLDTTCESSMMITSVLGGMPPYEFSMGGSFQSSPMFTGLAAGKYLVTIKDRNNCVASESVSIASSDTVVITNCLVEPPTCPGVSDGSITVSAQSPVSQTLQYLLMGPVTRDAASDTGSVLFSTVPSGLYKIEVIDNKSSCSAKMKTQVPVVSPITFSPPFVTPVTCKGAQNGTILLSQVIGGTSPYTYSIETKVGFIPVGEPFMNLEAGTYPVTVRDYYGCESMLISVTVLPAEKITIYEVGTTPATGYENNGTLCVVAKSNTALQYALNDGPFQYSPEFTNLAPGTYRVVVNRWGDTASECATCCTKIKRVKIEREL